MYARVCVVTPTLTHPHPRPSPPNPPPRMGTYTGDRRALGARLMLSSTAVWAVSALTVCVSAWAGLAEVPMGRFAAGFLFDLCVLGLAGVLVAGVGENLRATSPTGAGLSPGRSPA